MKRNPENYNILKSQRQYNSSEWSDGKNDFSAIKKAFDIMGLDQTEQMNIYRIVASVLLIGNMGFTSINNIDGSEGCSMENDYGKQPLSLIKKNFKKI